MNYIFNIKLVCLIPIENPHEMNLKWNHFKIEKALKWKLIWNQIIFCKLTESFQNISNNLTYNQTTTTTKIKYCYFYQLKVFKGCSPIKQQTKQQQ